MPKSTSFIAAILMALPVAAGAEGLPSTALDTSVMPGKPVWGSEAAKVTPMGMDSNGAPNVVLLRVAAGSPATAAHATKDGQLRLAYVLKGTLYYGDGETVDHDAEQAYGPGAVLAIDSGTKHWVSTRESDLEMLLVAMPAGQVAPPVAAQLPK